MPKLTDRQRAYLKQEIPRIIDADLGAATFPECDGWTKEELQQAADRIVELTVKVLGHADADITECRGRLCLGQAEYEKVKAEAEFFDRRIAAAREQFG